MLDGTQARLSFDACALSLSRPCGMAKILIVEDDIETQEFIASLLIAAGPEIVLASDGEQGLKVIRDDQIDAVVTDLRMPVMNGLWFIRELRRIGDTIPIVAVSGHNSDQLVLAEDYGANAGLAKPLDKEELLQVINRIIADTASDWSNAWIYPEFGSVADR
jgi:two-component system chemotaxis response regulator CheY